MEHIAGIFYINLEARADRRQEMEGELAMMGISGERFPAFKTSPGIIGCGQSHSGVVKEAKARGYKNVLVLEDDFMFRVSKEEFWALLEKGLKDAPDYDVIMLGYGMNRSEPHSENLVKVLDAQAGSGYLVNEKFYDTLISTWDAGTQKLIETGRHWEYACDQIWKTIQPGAAWYAFRSRIGSQRPSLADTGRHPVWAAYTNC
jgi:GR25 family glycosyltransferase involved in LPS biosynthesis